MYTLKNFVEAETIEEAYELLMKSRTNTILGGTTYLKMGKRRIGTGIDLSRLGLDRIEKDGMYLKIGAYVTLRELEISKTVQEYADGVLSRAVSVIVGVQFRNIATIGASVFSRYGFSDIIPALLTVGAKIRLYHGGEVSLEDFLREKQVRRDILMEIWLPLEYADGRAACDSVRRSVSDYAIVNAAVYMDADCCRIAVGARPASARLAYQAGAYAKNHREENAVKLAEEAAALAIRELDFSSNMRGSSEYRKQAAQALIKRLLVSLILDEGREIQI